MINRGVSQAMGVPSLQKVSRGLCGAPRCGARPRASCASPAAPRSARRAHGGSRSGSRRLQLRQQQPCRASERAGSPLARATSMPPSSAPTSMALPRAPAPAGERAFVLPLFEELREPAPRSRQRRLAAPVCIGAGRVAYSAASMPHRHMRSSASTSAYSFDVGTHSRRRVRARRARCVAARFRRLAVALDERAAKFGLGGEVIMQACLGDPDLGGDVGVAEAVEAARLHQTLGHIQNTGRCVRRSRLRVAHRRR